MNCKKPFSRTGSIIPFGCGQCLPCRINRRRIWCHRIVLESYMHKKNAFLTLTYNNDKLPLTNSNLPTLVKAHPIDYIKTLRSKLDHKIRYFLVGEYGEKTKRPHYHLALFGLGEEDQELIDDNWDYGFTYTGSLTFESAQYIAGYVTKKLTQPDNEKNKEYRSKNDMLLHDRIPEFATMSLKRGIGAEAMKIIADQLVTEKGVKVIESYDDVPPKLRHGSKHYPLGRYLREQLRKELGHDTEKKKKENIKEMSQEMCILHEKAVAKSEKTGKSLTQIKSEQGKQKIKSLETRFKIFNNGGSL